MPIKVLILTPRIPFPLRDGGAIAMNQTIEGYISQGCDVSLLSMNTSRHWVDENLLPPVYQQLVHFKSVYVKTNVNPLAAFFNLFTDKSYNVTRFINKEFEKELINLLQIEKFDVIQFESIYTSPYLQIVRNNSSAKCFCRLHNLEYLIWQRLSEHESSFLKRKYLELLTNRLKHYELDILQKFDLLLPISKKEELVISKNNLNRIYHLPFGVDSSQTIPSVKQEERSCFHIGSMDWAPNIEGVQWFLKQVWKEAHLQLKDVTLYLAGKNMPPSLHSKVEENLIIAGEVEDVRQFSLEKNIMIVPLLSGAGIRIKIMEAMALGKTIISTAVGEEGIGAKHKESILIANTAEEFISMLKFCFNEKEKAKAIGNKARDFIVSTYQKDKIYSEFLEHIKLMS